MITRAPNQTNETVADRVEAIRDVLRQASGVVLFTASDPGADSSRSGSTFEFWLVRGRFLVLQVLANGQGVDAWYPSPTLKMNDLMSEVRGYVAHGWDSLRRGV